MKQAGNSIMDMSEVDAYLEDAFDFDVIKRRMYDPDMKTTPHYGLEKFHSVSKREWLPHTFKEGYIPHTLDHVKNLVRAYEYAVGSIGDVQCAWDNAHVVVLRSLPGHSVDINGHVVEPTMMIRAGYDSTAVVSRLGLFNHVCANGLFNLDRDRSMSTRITHNAMMEGRIETLARSIEGLSDRVEEAVGAVRTASTVNVSLSEFVREVYPLSTDASSRTRYNYESRVESIMMRVIRERAIRGFSLLECSGNPKVSAFDAYNAIQGYEQHQARRKNVKNTTERMVRAVDNKFVRKAASLAFATV